MFTDKTGTLTENDMQFRECSINGYQYVVSNHATWKSLLTLSIVLEKQFFFKFKFSAWYRLICVSVFLLLLNYVNQFILGFSFIDTF